MLRSAGVQQSQICAGWGSLHGEGEDPPPSHLPPEQPAPVGCILHQPMTQCEGFTSLTQAERGGCRYFSKRQPRESEVFSFHFTPCPVGTIG